jgi:hypothetical protein
MTGLEQMAGMLARSFAARVKNLPKELQEIFFEDLETAIDERLKALERSVKHED